MKQIKTEIISNKEIATDHKVISLKSAHLAKHSKPGQFVNVKCSGQTAPFLRRPFGVYRVRKDGIDILYKVIGEATKLLSAKKPGDILDVIGPLGNGFSTSPLNGNGEQKTILVAGGHGVAPLYALAEEIKKKNKKTDIIALIGARTKAHLLCEKEFKTLGAKVIAATEDGSKGAKGFITKPLLNISGGYELGDKACIYACGPKPMLRAVAEIANAWNTPCQISMEEYMGCGIGICMGCSLVTRDGRKLTCKDGPVFDAKDIVWGQ